MQQTAYGGTMDSRAAKNDFIKIIQDEKWEHIRRLESRQNWFVVSVTLYFLIDLYIRVSRNDESFGSLLAYHRPEYSRSTC